MKRNTLLLSMACINATLFLTANAFAEQTITDTFNKKFLSVKNEISIDSYFKHCLNKHNYLRLKKNTTIKKTLDSEKHHENMHENPVCNSVKSGWALTKERSKVNENQNISLGFSTWISSGETHLGLLSTGDETFYDEGSVVSDLLWENLDSAIIQFDTELKLKKNFFLYADYGFNSIASIYLTDKDFLTTGTEFSKSIHNNGSGDLWYLNLHLGRNLIESKNKKMAIRGFTGYQRRTEEMYATGPASEFIFFGFDVTFLDPTGPNQKALTWNYSFNSIKLGLDGKLALTDKVEFSGLITYIPYANLNAKDFHHLREGTSLEDAGSPFVTWDGSGDGFYFAGDISYQSHQNLTLSAGYRYWRLSSEDNKTTFYAGDGTENSVSRSSEFDSKRYGYTFAATLVF